MSFGFFCNFLKKKKKKRQQLNNNKNFQLSKLYFSYAIAYKIKNKSSVFCKYNLITVKNEFLQELQ